MVVANGPDILIDMSKKRVPKTRVSVTGIDPESLSIHVIDTNQAFLELIRSARTQIIIMGYRFTEHGDDHFIEILNEALERGKRVYLLTDHLYEQEPHLRKFFGKLMTKHHGLFKLWTYEDDGQSLMHIKSMLIDDERVYIGSANFSKRGISKNLELGIIIYEDETIKTVKTIFNWLIDNDPRISEVSIGKLRGN